MPALQQLVLFDSDPGIDDAMALAHLVCEPSINLKAVTSVFGNVDVTRATQNALNLLARWNGRHIPVFKGAHNPLVIPPLPPPAFIHGRNGLGNIELPHAARKAEAQDAPSAISRIARESNGKLRLIAVGPLTNLALALTLDPELVHHVHDVIVMGGSILEAGNINQWAEANFYNDPDAAAAVFAADWPVTMVGLDVTHQIMLSAQHLDQLAGAQPVIGEDLRAIAQLYLAFYRQRS
ncbi:MAG: nucleoside hydrolase, partial [Pseudomonadota bacterium]